MARLDRVLEMLEALVADNIARGPGTVVAANLSASLECVARASEAYKASVFRTGLAAAGESSSST